MCALIAPDAMPYSHRGGGGQRNGGWGGSSAPLGGVIFGPRGGGNRSPGGRGTNATNTKSAGTAEIARDSGGDSMSVNDASALEDTLARLRRRYTLFFNLPDGVQPGQERNIEVDLYGGRPCALSRCGSSISPNVPVVQRVRRRRHCADQNHSCAGRPGLLRLRRVEQRLG